MEAAHPLPTPDLTDRSRSERKCLVTGEVRPKDDLIRFVVSPDQIIVPDLAQNLPGRGLWVTARHDCIDMAARKNMFARAAKAQVTSDSGLADQVVQLMRKRSLGLLGLARRTGIAVLGQPQVEEALRKGKLAFLLLASDASQTIENPKPVPEYRVLSRNELGAAFGHDQIVYAGLKAHPLTEKLALELARLDKITKAPHISTENSEKK